MMAVGSDGDMASIMGIAVVRTESERVELLPSNGGVRLSGDQES